MALWVFATVGLLGILCGCLFRAPALVFLSFLSFGGGLTLAILAGWPVLNALGTAILLTATLQLGYLVGAGLCYVRQQHPRTRGVEIGAEFQRRSFSS
jgi:hypothetical protein